MYQELIGELQAVTQFYGLSPASVSELSSSSRNTTRSVSGSMFAGDTPHIRTEADIYPDYRDFYDAELVEVIAKIYAQDFNWYGYSPTL
jgi:hypothetical protein